ncbi:MAG: zinc ribbon domain-containing protein [Candidatus Hydrogenedentes bacterium]|nr:zinc ribbon domain-containing protein [Candidatus Hydrogenedentota bacterium]
MPTYSYQCKKCKHMQDLFHSMSVNPRVKCTECGGSCIRLVGKGSGIIFKGSGFYQTDYKNNGGKSAPKTESSNESRSESKTESSNESKSESKTENRTESKTESKAESKTESRTESKTESKPDAKPSNTSKD